MFRVTLRSLVFICEVAAIVLPLLKKGRRQKLPLLKKGRRQKLPFVLKEGVLLVLANWTTIRKYLRKNQLIKMIKELRHSFKFKN